MPPQFFNIMTIFAEPAAAVNENEQCGAELGQAQLEPGIGFYFS